MSILSLTRFYLCKAQPAVTTSKEYFEEAEIKRFGDNFEDQFFGLEVPASDVTELAVHKLELDSLDVPIVTELGDKAEMSISQLKQFLMDNSENPEGFIFYLKGKDGNLLAVYAYWFSDPGGWSVGALSVDDPYRWHAGRQIVSCN